VALSSLKESMMRYGWVMVVATLALGCGEPDYAKPFVGTWISWQNLIEEQLHVTCDETLTFHGYRFAATASTLTITGTPSCTGSGFTCYNTTIDCSTAAASSPTYCDYEISNSSLSLPSGGCDFQGGYTRSS
jgi:hypothetical protein